MKITSHFIGIPLKTELFSDIFVSVYNYLKERKIEDSVSFQNPLSIHITLYYLEKDIDQNRRENIKKYIQKYNCRSPIVLKGIDYFFREDLPYVLYLSSLINLPLKEYRDDLHENFQQNEVVDNSYTFLPHITLLRIQKPEVFLKHQKNIEALIMWEIQVLQNIDVSEQKLCLYAVNSKFKEEIQIQL